MSGNVKAPAQIGLLLLLSSMFSLGELQAQSGKGDEIAPLIDYHVHLLGPYALPIDKALPAAKVPEEIARLLEKRATLSNQDLSVQDLASVYTSDALLLDNFVLGRWVQEKDTFLQFLGLFRHVKYRIVPHAYAATAGVGHVAGTLVSPEGGKAELNIILGLAQRPDGTWRIASESVSQAKPPKYTSPITADQLIADMDKGNVRRALVLSEAFWVGGRHYDPARRLTSAKDNVTATQRENDWTAEQVARYPDRLLMACGVNPLEAHAIAEMRRCAKFPQNRAIKMNVGEGGDNINFHNPEHVSKLRNFFKAANGLRMPIVIHLGSAGGYGAEEVRIFLEQVVSAAPNIPIQIAHLSSGFQSPAALKAFADARAAGDPLTRNLYFDMSIGSFESASPALRAFVADSIRNIGLENVLYASDEQPGVDHKPTGEYWAEVRKYLPLTDAEFRNIADNVAPYMR